MIEYLSLVSDLIRAKEGETQEVSPVQEEVANPEEFKFEESAPVSNQPTMTFRKKRKGGKHILAENQNTSKVNSKEKKKEDAFDFDFLSKEKHPMKSQSEYEKNSIEEGFIVIKQSQTRTGKTVNLAMMPKQAADGVKPIMEEEESSELETAKDQEKTLA